MRKYKRLTPRQVEETARKIVKFVNHHQPLAFPEPALTHSESDTWASSVELEDSPVGAILISISVGPLGLFLHIRVRDPKRFVTWKSYNRFSGKFNLHLHRNEYTTYKGFLLAAQMDAEDHIRDIMVFEDEEPKKEAA